MRYVRFTLAILAAASVTRSPSGAQYNYVRTTAQINGNPVVLRGGSDAVIDGSFEGGLTYWNANGAAVLSSTSVRTGSFSLHLGGPGGQAGSAYQAVWLPDTKPVILEYWVGNVTQAEPWYLPSQFARIIDLSALACTPTQTFLNFPEFRRHTADISHFSGQPVYIQFTTARDPLLNSQGAGTHSEAYIDDVRILGGPEVYAAQGDTGAGLVLIGRAAGPNPTWLPDDIVWRVNADPWSHAGVAQGVAFGLPFAEGPHTAEYYSVHAGNYEAVNSLTVNIDNTAPGTVLRFLSPILITGGAEKVVNGGFGGAAGWTLTGASEISTDAWWLGPSSLKLGAGGLPGAAAQTISISPGSKSWLRFHVYNAGASTPVVTIKDTGGVTLWAGPVGTDGYWNAQTLNLSAFAGKTIELIISDAGSQGVFVDEVSLVEDPVVVAGTANSSVVMGYDHIDSTGYQVDGGAAQATSPINVPTAGPHTIGYWSTDYLGRSSDPAVAAFTVDVNGPTGSISINGGDAVTYETEVTLTLTASDSNGVSLMRLKLSPSDWGPWVPFQPTVAADFGNPIPETKTACVQFQDAVGNISPEYCDSIEYRLPGQVSIGEAKQLPLGSEVLLYQKKMTAFWQTDASNGIFYLEEPDRSAGIMIRTAIGFPNAVGALVTVNGHTGIGADPEMYVTADLMMQYGLVTALKGHGMNLNTLGGGPFGQQPGIGLMDNLNTIGKIVRVWGKVQSLTASYFVIDDGSAVMLGGIGPGVTVELPAFASQPIAGKTYEVTGISTAVNRNGSVVNHVRPRNQSDIKLLD